MERAIEIVEQMRDFARKESEEHATAGRALVASVFSEQATCYEFVAKALRAERPVRNR
jgi:hypothetical protein